ncbi:MAG TPA: ATP-binding protein [Thermoanaerobaculia bacterium]
MSRRSFRAQLLLGAVLATLGLLPLGHVLTIRLIRKYPLLQVRTDIHAVLLILVAAAFLVWGLSLWRTGLSPFGELRARLGALREGREKRIEGNYPAEVQPLVDDLNALLEHREQLVRRATAKAGDLAHGLKTPLAVLSREAELASAAGHTELASTLGQQIERMRRQVEHHLAQARAAAAGATPGAVCPVSPCVDGLARTLLRLHAGRGIAIEAAVSAEHAVRAETEDLEEMLGNLLDNACQWARSRVVVGSSQDDSRIVITIDDDGPGLAPSLRDAALQRGVRADEASGGSGLGLSIVCELAEVHGGSISLGRSPEGGLRARLELPAAAS